MGWTNLVDDDDIIIGIVGDKGWDLAGEFVDNLQALYNRCFGRSATHDEIIATVEFVLTEWDNRDTI